MGSADYQYGAFRDQYGGSRHQYGHIGTNIGSVDDQCGTLKDPYYDVIIMLKHSDKMEYVI